MSTGDYMIPSGSGSAYPPPAGFEQQGSASGGTSGGASGATAGDTAKAKGKKKVAYTSQACAGCRRRKTKCDVKHPTCGTCAYHGEQCVYHVEVDSSKKNASVSYVEALRHRLATLEDIIASKADGSRVLERQNQSLGRRVAAIEDALREQGVEMPSEGNVVKEEELDWGEDVNEGESAWVRTMDRLQLDEESDALYFFGPSSAYVHLNAGRPSKPAPRPRPPTPPESASMDWARYLPKDLGVGISLETHNSILDMFDAFFAPWCLVTDMARFRDDMRRCLSAPIGSVRQRTAYYSPMLHNAILAIGSFLWRGSQVPPFPRVNRDSVALRDHPSAPPTTFPYDRDGLVDSDYASRAFYNTAMTYFPSEGDRPMLSTVRALMLIASFNSSSARPNIGYLYFSLALRTTSVLGLNIDSAKHVEDGTITQEVKEGRDRCFYTVFVQDVLWSLAQGRFTMTFLTQDHDVRLPPIDPEEDRRPWVIPEIWKPTTGASERLPRGPSWTSSCFHWTVKLGRIQEAMVASIYGLKKDTWTHSVSGITLQLEAWANELPPPLRITHFLAATPPPAVITLQLTFERTVMLSHRPFYHLDSPGAEFSVRKCDASALRVVKLIELYDDVYGLNYAPLTSIQTIFVAGTILLLSARKSAARAAKRTRTSIEAVKVCINALDKMGDCWKWSKSTASILRGLSEKWLPHALDTPSPPANIPVHTPPKEKSRPPLHSMATARPSLSVQNQPPPPTRTEPADFSWIRDLHTIDPTGFGTVYPAIDPASTGVPLPPIPSYDFLPPPWTTVDQPHPSNVQAHQMFGLAAMQMQMQMQMQSSPAHLQSHLASLPPNHLPSHISSPPGSHPFAASYTSPPQLPVMSPSQHLPLSPPPQLTQSALSELEATPLYDQFGREMYTYDNFNPYQ
ncbi:hypothetical protein MNV49_006812 [Pseudohyphozyma bogoriensis]|nr:hypothetical protein MNV49_006812 [Pseudohyphozyma bogoriensis]